MHRHEPPSSPSLSSHPLTHTSDTRRIMGPEGKSPPVHPNTLAVYLNEMAVSSVFSLANGPILHPKFGLGRCSCTFLSLDRGASPSSVNTTLLQQLTRLLRLRHSFSQPLFSFVWPRMDSSCRAAFMSELHDERSDASVLVVYLYFCFLLFPPPPLPASSLGLRGWRAQPLDLEMAVSDPVSWSRVSATQSGRVSEGYSRTRFLRIFLYLVSSVDIYLAFSAFRLVFPSSLLCRHEVRLSPCR